MGIGWFQQKLIVEPGGKVLSFGSVQNAQTYRAFVSRVLPDGSYDTGFANGGFLALDTLAPGFAPYLDMVQYPDGNRLLVMLRMGQSAQTRLVRLLNDGSPDPGFGNGGSVTTDGVVLKTATSIAIDPQERILAAGSEGKVWRYTPDGEPDLSFGANGVLTLRQSNYPVVQKIFPGADGGWLIYLEQSSAPDSCFFYRLHADGSLDEDFGASFIEAGSFSAFATDHQHRIVMGGTQESDYLLRIRRFMPDGSPDASFGAGGVAVNDGTPVVHNYFIAIEPDDKILLGGNKLVIISPANAQPWPSIRRLNADGSLDTDWAPEGLVSETFSAARYTAITCSAGGILYAAGDGLDAYHSFMASYNYDGLFVQTIVPAHQPVRFQVTPNPISTRHAVLQCEIEEPGVFELRLLDAEGRTVQLPRQLTLQAGRCEDLLDFPEILPAGVYYLEVKGLSLRTVLKVVLL